MQHFRVFSSFGYEIREIENSNLFYHTMKKKKSLIIALFILLSINILSQETQTSVSSWRVGIELGTHSLTYDRVVPSQVRPAPRNNEYWEYNFRPKYTSNIWGNEVGVTYVSIKSEYQFTRNVCFASGIRFSFYNDKLEGNRYYFLWELPGDINTMNYLSVKSIEQSIYTLGLPVEFRFFPSKGDHVVRQYFLAGGMFNFATFTKTKVNMLNYSMIKYEEQVKKQLPRPNHFSSHLYAGVGLKIGRMNQPFVSVEVLFPMLSYKSSKISSFAGGGGVGLIGINAAFKVPISL